jgi:hypothetical protein
MRRVEMSTWSWAGACSPNRASRLRHVRRNRFDVVMSAHITRAVGSGNSRYSHCAGVAGLRGSGRGAAAGRFWATAIFRSRQPFSRVWTLPASTVNPQLPSAARKAAAELVSPACQRATRPACRSQ